VGVWGVCLVNLLSRSRSWVRLDTLSIFLFFFIFSGASELSRSPTGKSSPQLSAATATMGSTDAYSMGKMIGKGSFGEVFLCKNRRTSKTLVMKKMRLTNVPGATPSQRCVRQLSTKVAACAVTILRRKTATTERICDIFSEKEMESYRLEVQLLSDLCHPGIVE
jgi:serine/threonine protein kinase